MLLDVINELGSSKKNFILMGDFNYRFLHWPQQVNSTDITCEAREFCQCLDDNCFTQHVTEHTRNDAIIDLVIFNKPNMVHDLESHGNLPGRDHNVLSRKLDFITEQRNVR